MAGKAIVLMTIIFPTLPHGLSLVRSGGNGQPGVPCTSSLHDDPYLSAWLGSTEYENDGRLTGR